MFEELSIHEGDFQGADQLMREYAVVAAAQQMATLHPCDEFYVSGLENFANLNN